MHYRKCISKFLHESIEKFFMLSEFEFVSLGEHFPIETSPANILVSVIEFGIIIHIVFSSLIYLATNSVKPKTIISAIFKLLFYKINKHKSLQFSPVMPLGSAKHVNL
nr:MAG TPA: hypothetical protein [Caudoviricetes sp.]